jgi:hypothetical protein
MELIILLIIASIIIFLVFNRVKEKKHSIQIQHHEIPKISDNKKNITKIRIDKQKIFDEEILSHLPEDKLC